MSAAIGPNITRYKKNRAFKINAFCSIMVRVIAFQAIDPGSTPGKRKISLILDFY
jgi:hypothetical protein